MTAEHDLIEREIERRLSDGSFPGGVLCIARSGSVIHQRPFGLAVALPEKIPAALDTVYDVASLTKPLITTPLVLLEVRDGDLELATTLGELFENCPADKKEIAIADLLSHRAGLIDWYPLFARGAGLEDYRDAILEIPLTCRPRTEVVYSCAGFILLAAAIEKVAGRPFVPLAEERILQPLGLKRTSLGKPAVPLEQVAATEDSSFTEREMIKRFELTYDFREGIIWGEPHDTNSFAAGGSAGNSGLFTTAAETLELAEQFGPRSRLFDPETLALVGGNETPFGPKHFTLGWQLASSPGCSAGPDLGPESIGHTGFTGCSVWFDRRRDVTVILFTNRVHPQASRADMTKVRAAICTLALATIA